MVGREDESEHLEFISSLPVEPHTHIPHIDNLEKNNTPRSTQTSENREVKSTEFQVSVNLFKVFIGIGVLSLGYGMSLAGIIQANILMIVGASFTYWSINILITIVEKMNIRVTSFDQLSYLLFGPWCAWLTKICVVILQIGTGVCYVYYFGIFFKNIFCYFDYEFGCDNNAISLIIVLFMIIPLHAIRTLTKYFYFSLIADILIIFSLMSVTGYLIYVGSTEGFRGRNLFEPTYFPAFFGISLFSIESLSIILEIRDSMKNPLKFRPIFMRQFIITLLLYTLLPTFFYVTLGDHIREIILFNIPMNNILSIIVQTAYGIALILSYPIQMYPVFLMMEKMIRTKADVNSILLTEEENASNKKKFNYKVRWIIARIGLCLILVSIAYLIPDFAWFLNVLGAIGSTILGMILPVVLAEKYFIILGNHKEQYPPLSRYFNIVTMLIGIVGGTMACYYSLDYMIGKA